MVNFQKIYNSVMNTLEIVLECRLDLYHKSDLCRNLFCTLHFTALVLVAIESCLDFPQSPMYVKISAYIVCYCIGSVCVNVGH